MARIIPDCPSNPPCAQEVSRNYEIEIVTPLVGGGAIPGETDPDFPVRSTAIRGQLRHWWRLAAGRQLGEGMWQREEEIFGSTDFPSPLTVRVTQCSQVESFDPSDRNILDQFGPVAYALFASIENRQHVAKEGIRFDLVTRTISQDTLNRRRAAQNRERVKARKPLVPSTIDPIQSDIDAALHAWLSFGGLGGRTRRGCGAIFSKAHSGKFPAIPGRILVGKPESSSIGAWRIALQLYRDFRQSPRGRKHAKTLPSGAIKPVPGRSHWPEADSIRQITGCALKPPSSTPASGAPADEDTHDHSVPVVPASLLPAFPKAVLGLPINFHFADGPPKDRPAAQHLDPQNVQLYPLLPATTGHVEKAERMASPVITRPIWLDGKWHPAIIVLDTALPSGFKVRLEGKSAALGGDLAQDVSTDRIVAPQLGSLTPMRGQASAIDALIECLTKDHKWRIL